VGQRGGYRLASTLARYRRPGKDSDYDKKGRNHYPDRADPRGPRHPNRPGVVPQCGRETDMVNLQTAAALTRADLATAQARLQSGDWHASAAADGTLRVCLASLPAGIAGVLGLARRLGPGTTVSDPKK
jgi:hypothetical protein